MPRNELIGLSSAIAFPFKVGQRPTLQLSSSSRVLVKRDENECQIDEIQSVTLYWGTLGKLEFYFLESLPM